MPAIGRVFMTNPGLIILVEATEGLAPAIREQIWKALKDLKSIGLSILVIDKHLDALTRVCDRLYIIEKGRVAWEGTSRQFEPDPSIRGKFLGV